MTRRSRRGMALATALCVLMVVFITGSSLVALSLQSMRRSRLDDGRTRAMALAEAGAEKAIYYLRTTAPDGTTTGAWRTSSRTETITGQGDYTMVVADGTGDNAGKIVITSTGHAVSGASSSTVYGTGKATATASSLEMRRTIRVVVKLTREDVSVWNNAVFGGVGQGGKSINGNTLIAGSVHLLGDGETYTDLDGDGHWDNTELYTDLNFNGKYDMGEPFVDIDGDGHRDSREPFNDVNGNGVCDPPLTVTDLSSDFGGTAQVLNNYATMTTTLQNLLPAPPTVQFAGETVQSLSAKFRAKHGFVSISGTAGIGLPQAVGDSPAVKETVDGTYVSDGFGGNQGASQVFADNGTTQKYDLGDNIISFPTLTAPVTKNGVAYTDYMAYLQSNALVINGDLNFSPGNSVPKKQDSYGNMIQVSGSGQITISGIVFVNGNINITDSNGNKTLKYTGQGTLVSTGNINIDTDMLPNNATFPVTNRMGFIARHNINLGVGSGASQLSLAGAFYAQEKIVSAKQNELAGTFVSSYFEMTNVPHMYQVPVLPDNLPPGMPGAGRIWVKTVRVDSWRETT